MRDIYIKMGNVVAGRCLLNLDQLPIIVHGFARSRERTVHSLPGGVTVLFGGQP